MKNSLQISLEYTKNVNRLFFIPENGVGKISHAGIENGPRVHLNVDLLMDCRGGGLVEMLRDQKRATFGAFVACTTMSNHTAS